MIVLAWAHAITLFVMLTVTITLSVTEHPSYLAWLTTILVSAGVIAAQWILVLYQHIATHPQR